MNHPIVLAITGASGVAYGRRLLEVLVQLKRPVHLTISAAAAQVFAAELDLRLDPGSFRLEQLLSGADPGAVQYFRYTDLYAPMASGSFLTAGMVICPCSGGALSAVASGASRNLIERAADVHLKERRPLILVQRETPLSLVHLENMRTALLAGATILPAMPAWYHGAAKIDDLVDFVVARILDQLGIEHQLMRRWGGG